MDKIITPKGDSKVTDEQWYEVLKNFDGTYLVNGKPIHKDSKPLVEGSVAEMIAQGSGIHIKWLCGGGYSCSRKSVERIQGKNIWLIGAFPKFEYMLHTWGGFYNEEHQAAHGKEPGYFYFDTDQERTEHIAELKAIEASLGARVLVIQTDEGYHLRSDVMLHRIIKWKGEEYYTTRDMFRGCDHETALYHMEYKWYPGFNDYPLGQSFPYDECAEDIEIVQEWVTGSFNSILPDRD